MWLRCFMRVINSMPIINLIRTIPSGWIFFCENAMLIDDGTEMTFTMFINISRLIFCFIISFRYLKCIIADLAFVS